MSGRLTSAFGVRLSREGRPAWGLVFRQQTAKLLNRSPASELRGIIRLDGIL